MFKNQSQGVNHWNHYILWRLIPLDLKVQDLFKKCPLQKFKKKCKSNFFAVCNDDEHKKFGTYMYSMIRPLCSRNFIQKSKSGNKPLKALHPWRLGDHSTPLPNTSWRNIHCKNKNKCKSNFLCFYRLVFTDFHKLMIHRANWVVQECIQRLHLDTDKDGIIVGSSHPCSDWYIILMPSSK